jgi:hypothetical protein
MKTIVIIILLFCYSLIFAQINCDKDSVMYSKAYNYIANNIGDIVFVSDTIIYIDGFFLLEKLTDFPEEKEKLKQFHEDLCYGDKEYLASESFYSSCISSIFSIKDTLANYILFFSPIDDNILLASVFPINMYRYEYNPYRKRNIFSFKHVSRFTTEQCYLFIFGKNKTTPFDVFSITIHVD